MPLCKRPFIRVKLCPAIFSLLQRHHIGSTVAVDVDLGLTEKGAPGKHFLRLMYLVARAYRNL